MVAAMLRPALLALLVALPCSALAQDADANPDANEAVELEKERAEARAEERARRLEAVRADMQNARERREALTKEIAALEASRAELTRALVAVAGRRQETEGAVAATEAQLDDLGRRETIIRRNVEAKRAVLAEVLAALQRLGADPPPALAVSPRDAVGSVRSSILLGAVIPRIRAETAALKRDLDAYAKVRGEIVTAREKLAKQASAIADDETRLQLLVERKAKLAGRSRTALLTEQRRAAELADRARSLTGLISTMEREIAAARRAAEAARAADERRAAREAARLSAARANLSAMRKPLDSGVFADTARREPAVAFAKAKGLLPKPAAGVPVHGFGAKIESGTARNLALSTRAGALVRSPADGHVLYAGPFRSYGHLLILDAGDEYHIVLMGLASLDVALGDFVLTGEPVGRMGGRINAATRGKADPKVDEGADGAEIEVTQRSLSRARPVLYVEFRHKGVPIDPDPWWAKVVARNSGDD